MNNTKRVLAAAALGAVAALGVLTVPAHADPVPGASSLQSKVTARGHDVDQVVDGDFSHSAAEEYPYDAGLYEDYDNSEY